MDDNAKPPELTERELGLVRWVLAKHGISTLSHVYEDAFSGGMEGLWEAWRKRDGRIGWASYASAMIWRRAVDELRRLNHRGRRPQAASLEGYFENLGIAPSEAVVSTSDTEASALAGVDLRALVDVNRGLVRDDRIVATGIAVGVPLTELAQRLGVSESRVSQRAKRIRATWEERVPA